MNEPDDLTLLHQYVRQNSDDAFAQLVSRRVNFVYSAALRQVRDPHLAEEITQAVFIILAQKAGKISDKTILTGWFFRTTRFVALAQIRAATKQSLRTATMGKDFQMQTADSESAAASDELWNQLAPLLDDALAQLGETDRQAVLLRFFENKSLAEVGHFLGIGEDTARKRIARALEKLHRYFNKCGVSSTTAILAGELSTHSLQAAPVGLAKTISAVAVVKGAAASASTLTLIKGALKIMAWSKMKTVVIATGIAVILATSVTPYVWYYHLAPTAWKHRLEAVYCLRHGELVRHISPPYIPERLTYYQTDNPGQAKAIPAGPNVLVFLQNKQGQLSSGGYTFGPKQFPLKFVLQLAFKFEPHEFEGPNDLLDLTVNGDWTISESLTNRDTLLAALEPILFKATQRHIIFDKRTVERDVIVVSGSHFTIKPGSPIQLYAEKLTDEGYYGYGDLDTFLNWVGNRLKIRLINETEIKPDTSENQNLSWVNHLDSDLTVGKSRQMELTDKILKNLTDQTGLIFTREKRPVDVWFVMEQK